MPPKQLEKVSGSDESKSWGLKVPGRPPTPSEGAAQLYTRVGPKGSQKIVSFENGTCLTFGPMDRVDVFDLDVHPFPDQVAEVDKAIHDVKAVHDRYEATEETDDAFQNFRSLSCPPEMVTEVTLASGTYKQVPSKYANLTNMVSIYNRVGKVDETTHGDTRYGTTGRPPPESQPRFLPRGPPGPPGGPPAPRYYHRPGPGQTPDNSRARRITRRAAQRDDLLDQEEEEADHVQSRFLRHLAAEQQQHQHIAAGSYIGGNPVQSDPQAPSLGYYNRYIIESVEHNVHDSRPALRPPPGFEHLAHSRLRRSRSSITVLEDDSDRVKGLLRSRQDSYAQEGFPRMQFQPPTPNMAAAGPVNQNRAILMEDRPSSTDSGWFPPPIERSASGMDFHARPTGLLSPASRSETTREQPLTASSHIWGTADPTAGSSRGPSPLKPGSNCHGMGGRRLYESASYGPSRISTPSNSNAGGRVVFFAGVLAGPSAGPISRPSDRGQPRPGSVPRGPRNVSSWW